MKEEIWKDIPGYEGVYQVSSIGRVRSVDRVVTRRDGRDFFKKGQIQKLQNNGHGYLYKQLKHKGKIKNCYIHKLVLLTFKKERPKGMVICHLDGDTTNNRLDNLRYDTPLENNIDQFRHGTKKGKLSEEDVIKVRKMYKEGFKTKQIAEYFNVGRWIVQRINNDKNYSWLNDDGTIRESENSI